MNLFDMGPGVAEIETSRAVWAGGHAEPASDAAVVIDHDNAVLFPFERGLGGAGPDTGRIIAMVA